MHDLFAWKNGGVNLMKNPLFKKSFVFAGRGVTLKFAMCRYARLQQHKKRGHFLRMNKYGSQG